MISQRLTTHPLAATRLPMERSTRQAGHMAGQSARRAWGAAAVLETSAAIMALAALAGCISVNAPDKPIVIELNINIKQEVIYRLAADAGNTIDSNPDIF
jgi:hypothetical protein